MPPDTYEVKKDMLSDVKEYDTQTIKIEDAGRSFIYIFVLLYCCL